MKVQVLGAVVGLDMCQCMDEGRGVKRFLCLSVLGQQHLESSDKGLLCVRYQRGHRCEEITQVLIPGKLRVGGWSKGVPAGNMPGHE